MNRLTIFITAALIIGTLSCAKREEADSTPAGAETHSETRAHMQTEVVSLSSFRRTINTTGTVAFDQNRSTQVLSPISGPVARLLVNVGTPVSRGEAMAIVSSPDFATALSALRKAEASARNARHIADLDQQLFNNDAIARRDLEQAQTDAISAEADRDAAIQQLRSLGVDERTIADIRENRPVPALGGVIRSPIGGIVVEKLITPGQLLQTATPCFTVADLSTMWVMANVFESDLAAIHIGDPATVITEGNTALPGRVDYIAALVDPNTRAVSVRVEVPNRGGMLKRDMYVDVAIQSQRPATGILIPVSAVLRDEQNVPFVFVARPDHTFERRTVQLGARVNDRQEITGGLNVGDALVVSGALFLQSEEHGS